MLINRPELAQELLTFMGSKQVCLMRGHGVTVTGASVEDATVRAITFEALCRIVWQLTVAAKPPRELMPEDVREFRGLAMGRPVSIQGDRQLESIWRYWVKMLDYRGPIVPDISMAVPEIAPV